MANADPSSVLSLRCEAAEGVSSRHLNGLCASLTKHLSEGASPWQVQHVSAATDTPTQMTLTLLGEGKNSLRAKLSWQQGEQSGESPEYRFSVMDAKLGTVKYDSFLSILLRGTDWPPTD